MIVELTALVAGALLLVSSRTLVMLWAYVALALIATAFIAPALGTPLAAVLFGLAFALKIVVAPSAVLLFLRVNPGAHDLRSSTTLPGRLLVAIGCGALAAAFATTPVLHDLGAGRIAIYVVLCGVVALIVHRNLIAHVLGLLALGTGVTMSGALLAPALPESIELGVSFDALVATFIGLALIRAFAVHDPLLDVESLRHLRG